MADGTVRGSLVWLFRAARPARLSPAEVLEQRVRRLEALALAQLPLGRGPARGGVRHPDFEGQACAVASNKPGFLPASIWLR